MTKPTLEFLDPLPSVEWTANLEAALTDPGEVAFPLTSGEVRKLVDEMTGLAAGHPQATASMTAWDPESYMRLDPGQTAFLFRQIDMEDGWVIQVGVARQ